MEHFEWPPGRWGQYIWKKEFRDLKETRLKRLKTLENENPG